jgi:hypothetical protein
VAGKSNSRGSLAALAAAALASPVALVPAGPLSATNFAVLPSEAASLSNDALIRTAQYSPVRKKYIFVPNKKPRYLPPNPCRIKTRCKR